MICLFLHFSFKQFCLWFWNVAYLMYIFECACRPTGNIQCQYYLFIYIQIYLLKRNGFALYFYFKRFYLSYKYCSVDRCIQVNNTYIYLFGTCWQHPYRITIWRTCVTPCALRNASKARETIGASTITTSKIIQHTRQRRPQASP